MLWLDQSTSHHNWLSLYRGMVYQEPLLWSFLFDLQYQTLQLLLQTQHAYHLDVGPLCSI